MVSDRFMAVGLQTVAILVLASYLGPSRFGVYAFASSSLALAIATAGLGLDQVVVRDLAESSEASTQPLRHALVLRLFACITIASALVAYVLSRRHFSLEVLALLIVMPGLSAIMADTYDLWFQAKLRSKDLAVVRVSVAAAVSLAIIVVAVIQGPFLAVLWTIPAGGLLLLGTVWWRYRSLNGPLDPFQDWQNAGSMLKVAWPYAITALASSVLLKGDQLVLSFLGGRQDVGLYALAAKVSEVLAYVPIALAGSFFPIMVRNRIRDTGDYEYQLTSMFRALFRFGVTAALTVTLLAGFAVRLLLGEEFIPAIGIVRLHVWSFPFLALAFGVGKYLVAEKLASTAIWLMSIAAVVNIGLNLLLIPLSGPYGAAVASLVSYAWCGYIGLWTLKPLRPLARIVTASASRKPPIPAVDPK